MSAIIPITTIEIRVEHDVVLARRSTLTIAEKLGFNQSDQVRIATAVSELARNAFQYAGSGWIKFVISGEQQLRVVIHDDGPSIPNIGEILSGQYLSPTGLGVGLLGAKKLMDHFAIETKSKSGTTITIGKTLPKETVVTDNLVAELAADIVKNPADNPYGELLRRNHDLLLTLEELERNREQLAQLNRELEETNRGVVALYAELEEKAEYLRRASDLKTRFLSNMTHEFRTPVNSIISLARLLLDRVDGDLNAEQEKQLRFIESASQDLSALVNNLLDLAKAEAGKLNVDVDEFTVRELFVSLRGTLGPLLVSNKSIKLIFEDAKNIPILHTDESKVSQILRNLISNALKFTERGEIRVTAKPFGVDQVEFTVADTGCGIDEENQTKIFEEFVQLKRTQRAKARGTGLGLPITKKLSQLLGGEVFVRSRVGEGSAFTVRLPVTYSRAQDGNALGIVRTADPLLFPILIVDSNTEVLFAYEKLFKGTPLQLIPARQLSDARLAIEDFRPFGVVLTIPSNGEEHWSFLHQLKTNPATKGAKVIVISRMEDRDRAFERGADAFFGHDCPPDQIRNEIELHVRAVPKPTILLVDDEEYSRYVIGRGLKHTRFGVIEASGGKEALSLIETTKPAAVMLDLNMPEMDGFAVLKEIRQNPATASLPVIIHSGKKLSAEQRKELEQDAIVLEKDSSDEAALQRKLRQAFEQAGLISTMR